MIGKKFAQYLILEKIGEGGMGEVYRARDERLDRDVAVKLLPEAWSSDPHRIRRFEREAKVLASLVHPNIASVFGFYEDDGVRFIAMELIEGDTLAPGLPAEGLPLDRLLDIGIPFAEAIGYAHDKGVIHRDLKPSNIMLDRSGRVRVLDFGVAGLRQSEADNDADETLDVLTTEGDIVGTVAYMAPEQLEGRPVDARADVFSIGVVLYELATGDRPFRGNSAASVLSAILRDDPVSLSELRPDLPPDLERLLRRCLQKNAERRIQTAVDIRNELEDLRAGIRTGPPALEARISESSWSLVERSMVIRTEHVRRLSTRVPRMVGDSMTYLDNQRASDVLVVYLHGIGGDQSHFEEVVRLTPYRAVAPSLYGFGEAAVLRPPLPFVDHNRLVAYLVEEVDRHVGSRFRVLVGHSSGADQMLHIIGSEEEGHPRADGLVLLGPEVNPGPGFVSGPYSELTDDPAGILETIRGVAAAAEDLETWLTLHRYLVSTFGKFGADTAAVRTFAQGLIEAYDEARFFELFRTAMERVQHIRCVFSADERDEAEQVLGRHIDDDVFGDHFSEKTITVEAIGHLQLKNAKVLLPYVEEIVQRLTP